MSFQVLREVQPGSLTAGKMGGQTVPLLFEGHPATVIQTPRLDVKHGIQVAEWGGEKKGHLQLHFRRTDVHADFSKALQDLDATVLQAAVNNSAAWFRSDMDRHAVEHLYTSYLNMDDDSPFLKINVAFKDEACAVTTFKDGDEVRGAQSGFGAGSSVVVMLQPVSLWFFNRKFGIRWKAHELHFSSKPAASLDTPYLFVD